MINTRFVCDPLLQILLLNQPLGNCRRQGQDRSSPFAYRCAREGFRAARRE